MSVTTGRSGENADDRGRIEAADLAAVHEVLSGNVDAFAGIVARWQARLLNLAWRFCRDRAMAEDMAQEAFVKAFRALGSFRREAAFSTWLTAVAINSYRSFLRDRPPLPVLVDVMPAHATDAVSHLLAEERAANVRKLVLTLPKRYREAMVLFYFEEMNVEKAATLLGIPQGTLKARLHRGRALLKRRLAATSPEKKVTDGRD